MMKRRLSCLAMAVFGLFGSTAAMAHGMYVAERHGGLGVVIGFSSNDDAYPLEKVASSVGYDVAGKVVPTELVRHDTYVSVTPGADTATLVTTADYGFYSKAGGVKWTEKKKSLNPGATEGLHAIKYNVFVMKAGATGKSHDLGMEIVPLEDPMTKQLGDKLPVQLLLDGKPFVGKRLIEDFTGNDTYLTEPTDADGRTVVTLRASRLNVIALETDHYVKGEKDLDFYRYFTTLSFELDHQEPD